MINHNLPPEVFQQRLDEAAYYDVEREEARKDGDTEREAFCQEMRLEALRALGMVGLQEWNEV